MALNIYNNKVFGNGVQVQGTPRASNIDVSSHANLRNNVLNQAVAFAGLKTGDALTKKGVEELQARSTTLAIEAMQEYEKEELARTQEYITTKKRKNAASAVDDYNSWHDEAITKYKDKLKDDEDALRLFSLQSGRTKLQGIAQAGRYAMSEDHAWRTDVLNNEKAKLFNIVGQTEDQNVIAQARNTYKAKRNAMFIGIDHKADDIDTDAKIATNQVEFAIGSDKIGRAKELANQYKNELGANYNVMQIKIKDANEALQKKYEMQQERAEQAAIDREVALSLITFSDDYEKAYKHFDSLAKGDPLKQAKFRVSFDRQATIEKNMKENIKEQEFAQNKTRLFEQLEQVKLDPEKTNNAISEAYLLSPELGKAVQAQAEILANPQKYALGDDEAFIKASVDVSYNGLSYENSITKYPYMNDTQKNNLLKLYHDETEKGKVKEQKNIIDYYINTSKEIAALKTEDKKSVIAQIEYLYFNAVKEVKGISTKEAKDIAYELTGGLEQINTLLSNEPILTTQDRLKVQASGTIALKEPTDEEKRIIGVILKNNGKTVSQQTIKQFYLDNSDMFR